MPLTNPQAIKAVVFDFDGTLVMSNAIKRDGFTAVAEAFPDGVARMDAIMAEPPGDRYTIMDAFAAHYNENGTELAARYAQWCEDNILVCDERTGATETLAALKGKGIAIWLNSATPQEPLREVVKKRYPSDLFAGVLGGHGCKVKNLNIVMETEGLSPEQILMVGDGFDDRDGAAEIGCPFVGLDAGTLEKTDPNAHVIADLTHIIRWLEG